MSRCWPAASSLGSAKRPTAASGSPWWSASFPSGSERLYPQHSWPVGCLARCSASASAARWQRRTAGAWRSWSLPLRAWRLPSSIRCWSGKSGWHGLPLRPGSNPMSVSRPSRSSVACSPDGLSNAFMPGVDCSCSWPAHCRPGSRHTSIATMIFQWTRPDHWRPFSWRSAGSEWSFVAWSAIGCSAGRNNAWGWQSAIVLPAQYCLALRCWCRRGRRN